MKSAVRREGCSMFHCRRTQYHDVSPANGSPGARHDDKCPAVGQPPLPPAVDRRNVNTHVRQVRRRHAGQALKGHHCQLEGYSLPDEKPVKLTYHWGNVIELPGPSHSQLALLHSG